MRTNEILIIPKITKVEWDMRRLRLTEQELVIFYRGGKMNVERIFNSHRAQKARLQKILSLLEGARVVSRDELTHDALKGISLVIAFGGDNHFQYVSHFITDTPLLGINADPERSEGALTLFTVEDFERIIPNLLDGKFSVEEWPRLAVSINKEIVKELATSEIFIGEEKRALMSRHILKVDGKSEEQKGSGLLIANGAGSTGWYDSACRYLFPDGNAFPKTASEARFILTEPYRGKLSPLSLKHGAFYEGDKLVVTSLSDSQAFLSIDSLVFVRLLEGAEITIQLGRPLRVVRI